MNGKTLHSIYREECLFSGIEVDDWDELQDHDQRIWENFAEKLAADHDLRL